MTNHDKSRYWGIPAPVWKTNGTLWMAGRYLGSVRPFNGGFLAETPGMAPHHETSEHIAEGDARKWVEAQAMKALGAKVCE